jgi:molybdopterin-guanine dinucleotide biosynthesis protein
MKALIISITGAHSGCGKTNTAEAVIKGIPLRWGAIKYSKTPLYASLTDDVAVIGQPGKDTDRLRKAGAEKVIWIQSPFEELVELLDVAMSELDEYEGIIIEGNSPAEIISPNLIIFVFGDDPEIIKPSARALISRADFILHPSPSSLKTPAKVYNKNSEEGLKELIRDIMGRRALS